jgi:hypothetical protein
MDLYCEQQQEVMEISSEVEKKTETYLSSNEIWQEAKTSVIVKVAQKQKESTDSSDSVSDNVILPNN